MISLSPRTRFTLLAAAALAVAPASAHAAKPRAASLSITKVSLFKSTVKVKGRVTLPEDTAAQRARTRVLVTLTNRAGRVERLPAARITRQRWFKAAKATNLTGAIRVAAKVTIGGKASGGVR